MTTACEPWHKTYHSASYS